MNAYMYKFKDHYHNKVTLSFDAEPFSQTPKHVWIICQYGDEWLLTEHKERGLEFPGGKVEIGETAEEAAIREVKEETGGEIAEMHYISQYQVTGRSATIIKNVYFAVIDKITKEETYFETLGPVLLKKLPSNIKYDPAYSFIMKDNVLTHSLRFIEEKFINNRIN